MTRLGQIVTSGAMVVLALLLAVWTHSGQAPSPQTTWGSAYGIQDPDPGFWRDHPSASDDAPRLYSVGMSRYVATSRVTVLPESGLELTNFGAPGALVLESGGLVLTDADGIVEIRRGGASAATELAPVGIGSRLERGDRIVFRSSATVALRNPEATATSLLMITELADLPVGGALQ
jgi:hypothetical protein